MEFKKLEAPDYPDFLTLYNQSFPPDQRRSYCDGQHLAAFIDEKGGKFHIIAAKDEDQFLGFISYWIFEKYIYVEHFAVKPHLRGKKIGTLLLDNLINEVRSDILLEVELPDSEDNIRRIQFYQRNGFRCRDEIAYTQPPYEPGKDPVRLMLMTHGDVSLRGEQDLQELLHEVYNVNIVE